MDKAELLKNIGKKIRKVRLEKGLTQLDLVGKMQGDIDVTNISRIEAGRTNPTIFTIYRLAEALEVSILDLLKD